MAAGVGRDNRTVMDGGQLTLKLHAPQRPGIPDGIPGIPSIAPSPCHTRKHLADLLVAFFVDDISIQN